MISEIQIKTLEQYRDKSFVSSVLCEQSASLYSRLKTFINLPLILSSSAMSILNSSNFDPEDMKVPNIIINSCTALILSLISNFKITEKQNNFKSISLKFIKLTHQIEDELANNQENMTADIIRNIITSYDSLNEQIDYDHPEYIKNRFRELYKDKRTLPNILKLYY
jgi:hypothetical protein